MNTKSKPSRVRLIVIICLSVIVVGISAFGTYTWWSLRHVLPGGGITEPINGRYTIALLGADTAAWRADWGNSASVDSTTLLSVDADTGRTLVISVPRNLVSIPFVETSPLRDLYPDGYICPNQTLAPCMLAMVYQTGLDHADLYPGNPDPGAQATVDALEGITGLTVNYYAFVDMDGFSDLVDAVGGIDLTIRTRIAVGAMGQTMYWIEPGEHHFDGEEALWYIRTRVDTSDYVRMTREKCVLLSVMNEFGPKTVATHFTDLIKAASNNAHTNIPASQVSTLVSLASQATTWTISTLNLTPPLIDPLNPNYTQIRQMVSSAVAQVEALDNPAAASVPISEAPQAPPVPPVPGAGPIPGVGQATTPEITTTDLNTTCGY